MPRCALKASASVDLTRRSHMLDMVTSPPEGCNVWEIAIFYEPESDDSYRLVVPSVAVLKGNESSTMGGESKSSFLSCQGETVRLPWLVWLSAIDFFSSLTLIFYGRAWRWSVKVESKAPDIENTGSKLIKVPRKPQKNSCQIFGVEFLYKKLKNGILRGGQYTGNRKISGYSGLIMGQGQVSSGSSDENCTSIH